eukprot:5550952-Amphidinium_carterae.5
MFYWGRAGCKPVMVLPSGREVSLEIRHGPMMGFQSIASGGSEKRTSRVSCGILPCDRFGTPKKTSTQNRCDEMASILESKTWTASP